jgi:Ca2+-binding RTX toxin-like protein
VSGDGANPATASDFAGGVLPTGTVTFAAGETSKTVTVLVAGDTTVEPNEGFKVTLSDPTGGASIAGAVGTATLLNDDVAPNTDPVASPDTGSVNEDATVLIDVLANDTDIDVGDTKTLVSVSATEKGASVSIVDGKVSYIADADSFDLLKTGQSVLDHFTYTMRDAAGATSTATVRVTVNGVADAPTQTGGGSADTLGGTAGDEKLDGGGGDDSLSAGGGADVLVGGLGNDSLDGGAGIDSLSGGDGNDRVLGGLGDDILAGGRGADLFVFGPAFGHDTVIDFKPGEDDALFQGTGLTSFADLTAHAAQVGANVLITLGSGDSLQLNGVTLASLAPADFLFV